MASVTEGLKAALADRYQIERELGQGGMATVYLAEDLKHERKVALKVLKPELAAVLGADRFVQEIKTTASLQHPHILPLFDSGQADGFLYYVMPYIEGETLRDKLDRETQLGIDEAVRITTEVADALDYAHRNGVIHRDIKPENILLHDGRPMVADFGIALAVSAAAGGRMTETGLSLGTPHYMSPEQATAEKEITNRSDIYSLACMTYEMLAGDPPHTGSAAQQIIMKIVTEEAMPVTRLRKSVPPNVAAALTKALQKLPADRFGSAADFAEALSNSSFTFPVAAAATEAAGPSPALWNPLSIATTALAALLLPIVLLALLRPEPPAPEPIRLTVTLPDFSSAPFGPSMTLSPDGSLLVYRMAAESGGTPFAVRRLSQLGATPLSGTEEGLVPFFSPDGRHIGFLADQTQIKRVAIIGGPPVTVADSAASSGSWGTDGSIYFVHAGGGIARVPEAGGTVERLTRPDTGSAEFGHYWPEVLPDGRGVIYTSLRFPLDDSNIAVLDRSTGEARVLIGGVYARHASSGHLVYARADGALLAVPFDDEKLEVTGSPVALMENIPVKTFGEAEFALAQNGTLIYGVSSGEFGIALVDRAGNERLFPTNEPSVLFPRVSPDGRYLALEVRASGGNNIWIYNLSDSTMSRLTFEGSDIYPEWTPDGRMVSFSRGAVASADRNIFVKAADGSGVAEAFAELPQSQVEGIWSPDGQWLVLRQGDRARGQNASLAALKVGSSDPPIELFTTPFMERSPTLSPDGRWIAYASTESGRDEVYIRPFPGPGGRRQVSSGGGSEPRWAHSGRELFYRSGTDLVAVEVRSDSSLTLGNRSRLFTTGSYLPNTNHAGYDVMPDDETFVFIRSVGEAQQVIMVFNWFDELKERTSQ